MDERRARIHDDLRGLIDGELLFEPIERAPYALDASLYEIDPLGVVVPRHRATTSSRWSATPTEQAIPLHPRGAGRAWRARRSGRASSSTSAAISGGSWRRARRASSCSRASVLDVVNDHLAQFGRRLGPDPSGPGVADDRRDDRRRRRRAPLAPLRHDGRPRRVASTWSSPAAMPRDARSRAWPDLDEEPADFKGVVSRKVATILRHHADGIARHWPRSPRNRAGYALGRGGRADCDRPRPARRRLGGDAGAGDRGDAADGADPARRRRWWCCRSPGSATPPPPSWTAWRFDPSACELFDWRSIQLARDAFPACRAWIPSRPRRRCSSSSTAGRPGRGARPRARPCSAGSTGAGQLAASPTVATRSGPSASAIMGLRRVVEPLLTRMPGPSRPVAVHRGRRRPARGAAGVPPAAPADPPAVRGELDDLRPRRPRPAPHPAVSRPGRPARPGEARAAGLGGLRRGVDVGGTVSGEHGCGLARTQFLRRQYGDLVHAFRGVKDAFDPFNLLNPARSSATTPTR